MPIEAIKVRGLGKVYPDGKEALKRVDLAVAEGDFFALLGPNGAGKTTALNIFTGLFPATSGQVLICGHELARKRNFVLRQIGLVPQEHNYDPDSKTVRRDLMIQAAQQGLFGKTAKQRVEEVLNTFGLSEFANRNANGLSGGEARKLDIALALVHQPSLLFLDEPTSGLDVFSRRALWNQLKKLNQDGTTIFLTTHNLEEADELAKHIAIINQGQIVTVGTPNSLKISVGSEVVVVKLQDDAPAEMLEKTVQVLQSFSDKDGQLTTLDQSVTLVLQDAGKHSSEMISRLSAADVKISSFQISQPSLEHVLDHYANTMGGEA